MMQGLCHLNLRLALLYMHYYYYYDPGDTITRVSRSSMVALHTLLSCVLHVASCSVRCSSLQSSLIMSIHLFFCLPLFLVPCTYPLYAILRYRLFFIRFSCPKYRSCLFRILSIIPILIFSLLNISSFLILSLLVTPFIFRRHAISNTLRLCFCFSFIVHVSALYSIGAKHQYLIHACFCRLAQFLGVPHLPQRLTSSPRQPHSPFHILIRPLLCADISSQIHKVLRLLQFLPFHLQAKFLVSFSQKLAFCLLYAYLHAHFCSLVRLLSTSSVIPFPVRREERCHPQISNLLSFHLRCQPLRLIYPVPLP